MPTKGPPRNGQVEPMNFPSTLSHKTVSGVDLFERHLLLLQHTIQLGSLSPQMCDIVSQLMGYQFFPANKNFRLKISWASSQHVGLKLTLTLVLTAAYSRVSSHRSCLLVSVVISNAHCQKPPTARILAFWPVQG